MFMLIGNSRSALKRNMRSKKKEMLRETNRRKADGISGTAFGGWPTFWLVGKEARLVWGSVVLVQIQSNLRGRSGYPLFCKEKS